MSFRQATENCCKKVGYVAAWWWSTTVDAVCKSAASRTECIAFTRQSRLRSIGSIQCCLVGLYGANWSTLEHIGAGNIL